MRQVQIALNLQPNLPGPSLNVSGAFDPATESRVRVYQRGLPVTGVVGDETYRGTRGLYPYGIANITIVATRAPAHDFGGGASRGAVPNFLYRRSGRRRSSVAPTPGWGSGRAWKTRFAARLQRGSEQSDRVDFNMDQRRDADWLMEATRNQWKQQVLLDYAIEDARPWPRLSARIAATSVQGYPSGAPALRSPSMMRSLPARSTGLTPEEVRRNRAIVNCGLSANPAWSAARASSNRPRNAKAAAR